MSSQAKISITFYIGPSDQPADKLSKNYVLKNWETEFDLRHLLDKIAQEINYISGYGIWSIKVQAGPSSFLVDYGNQLKPCIQEGHLYFRYALRFEVGRYKGSRAGPVRIEIPRIHLSDNDNLFKIKMTAVGNRRKVRQYGTIFHLFYDRTDPVLVSFLQKLGEGVFAPDVEKQWQHTAATHIPISWWELPQTQTSYHKWDKERKRQEAEEKKKKKLEKAGIVYKDRRQKQKADQVYIAGAADETLRNVYKIGISNAPGKRLQSLNTSSPFELKIIHKFVAEPAEEAEAQLHKMFANNRMSREWFRLTDEQIAELKQITAFKGGKFIKSVGAE
jgi:hypothetical protein